MKSLMVSALAWSRLLSFLLSFLLAFQPPAAAMSIAQQGKMKEFFELTELTRHEVSLKDFFAKVQPHLPQQVALQLKAYVDANPKMMIPKLSVSKVIGANGEEDVQISFTTKKEGSASFQIVGRGNTFAQIGTTKITFDDLKDMNAYSVKLEEAMPTPDHLKPGHKAKDFGLLTARDVNKLTLDEKRKYFKSLRELLGAMEGVENSMLERGTKKTSQNESPKQKSDSKSELRDYLFSLGVEVAEAKTESSFNAAVVGNISVGDSKNSCIYAGHLTNYGYKTEGAVYNAKTDKMKGHYACGGAESSFNRKAFPCTTEKPSKNFVQCNPDVYGSENPVCAPVHASNATEVCNSLADKYNAFPGTIKNSTQFDKFNGEISTKLNKLKTDCTSIKNDKNFRLEDQGQTCDHLNKRIDEILKVTCVDLAANGGGRFKDLKCNGAGAPPSGGTTTGTTPQQCVPGIGPQPPTAGVADATPTVPAPQAKPCVPVVDVKPVPVPGQAPDCSKHGSSPDYLAAVDKDCTAAKGAIDICIDKDKKTYKTCYCAAGTPGLEHKGGPDAGKIYSCVTFPGSTQSADGSSDGTRSLGGGGSNSSTKEFKLSPVQKGAIVGVLAMAIAFFAWKSNYSAANPDPKPTATYVPSTILKPHTRGVK